MMILMHYIMRPPTVMKPLMAPHKNKVDSSLRLYSRSLYFEITLHCLRFFQTDSCLFKTDRYISAKLNPLGTRGIDDKIHTISMTYFLKMF